MTPTEKHREMARAVLADLFGDAIIEKPSLQIVAEHLAKAEREGMRSAAEIARGSAGEYDFQAALAEGRDFDYGFYNGKNHAADRIEARRNSIEETHAPFHSHQTADRRDGTADRRRSQTDR